MSRQKTPEYKAIKNYIINTEKINREEIMTIVREHIEKIITVEIKNMLDSKWMRNYIAGLIAQIAKEGFPDRRFYGHSGAETLEDYIKREIRSILASSLLNTYKIEVTKKEQ